MKLEVVEPSRLNGRDVQPGEVVDLEDRLAEAWLRDKRARVPGSEKKGPGRPAKEPKQPELVPETDMEKLSRKKLLSLAQEAGLDPDECKGMSREDLILSIQVEQEAGGGKDGDPEPDLEKLSDEELLTLAEETGLDPDVCNALSREDLIEKIKEETGSGNEKPGQ